MVNPAQMLGFRIVLFSTILLLGACGRSDYSRTENAHEGEALVHLAFDYDRSKDPYTMQVTRQRGGAALEAPLHNDRHSRSRMTLSHTSEHSWFIGPRFSFSF